MEELLEENRKLKSTLRRAGMALAMTESFSGLNESQKTRVVSKLEPQDSFESVVSFSEHVESVVGDVLKEDADNPTIKESKDAGDSKESTDYLGGDQALQERVFNI